MKSIYIRYLRQILVFTLVLAAVAIALRIFVPGAYVSPALPFLVVFFGAASLLSFYYLLQASDKRFIRFVNTFLLSILVKLFLYAGILIAYVFVNRHDAVPFMLGFFVLYLCYTVFESVCIIRYTRPPAHEKPS